MVSVSDDQGQTSGHVASNEQNRRERLALVDPFQILIHVGFVAWEKRELGRAQKVLRGMVGELRLPKARYQRFGLRIRTKKRKKIARGVEVRGLALFGPFELWFRHAPAPFFNLTPGSTSADSSAAIIFTTAASETAAPSAAGRH
jgi:hypothetical protein